MRFLFKLGCVTAIATGSVIATPAALNAMPIARTGRGDAGSLYNIDWTCGPGFHVNPWGRCVPNYWRGGWYGPGWRRAYYRYPAYSSGGWYGQPGWGGGGYYDQPRPHHGWHEHEYEEHGED